MVATVDAVKILKLLQVLHAKYDDVIAKYPLLYKVESVSDTYMVCGGVNSIQNKTDDENKANAEQALRCIKDLIKAAKEVDMQALGIFRDLKVRVGVVSGPVNAV